MIRFVMLCTFVLTAFACSESDPEATPVTERKPFTGTIPESMKGYELYSWRENNQWSFTLITGTNRLKHQEEIVASENKVTDSFVKISVSGLTDMKSLLDRVPPESSVFWISDPSRVKGFSIPPSAITAEIQSHCESLQLNLQFIE